MTTVAGIARSAGLAWCLAAAALVLATVALPSADRMAAPGLRARLDSPEGVTLSNDTDGAAVFRLAGAVPGRPVTNCVAVHYRAPMNTLVTMYATVIDGGLAPYVRTAIEVGVGGGYGACHGFEPTATLYRGDLATLAATHRNRASGLPAHRSAAVAGTVTFRVTVVIADTDAAQGLRTDFELGWSAIGPDQQPDPPPAAQQPPAGPTPSTSPAGPAPSTSPGGTPRLNAPSSPGRSPTPSIASSASPQAAGESTPKPTESKGSSPLVRAVKDAIDDILGAIGQHGGPLAEATSVGFLAAMLVGAFVAVQHRIDRRDPKLALAPIRPPADLPFVDRSATV